MADRIDHAPRAASLSAARLGGPVVPRVETQHARDALSQIRPKIAQVEYEEMRRVRLDRRAQDRNVLLPQSDAGREIPALRFAHPDNRA